MVKEIAIKAPLKVYKSGFHLWSHFGEVPWKKQLLRDVNLTVWKKFQAKGTFYELWMKVRKQENSGWVCFGLAAA